jgi:predicted site-specific integrase-resolvase
MIVTAHERQNVLNLFNVSEAARQLGVDVQRLHRDIRAGRVRSPQLLVGRRLYYRSEDLSDLSTQYTEGESCHYDEDSHDFTATS